MDNLENESLIRQRQIKFFDFIKKKSDWIIYVVLAFVIYLAVWIRTRNLSGLRDITTGGWTLGPDLDPFLFLRWAKYIVENGSFFALDTMRYVPRGLETIGYPLPHYFIVWFHKLAYVFGSGSVEQSAVLYPVFMFALTVIAFFLLSRIIISRYLNKNYSNIGAAIATFIFSVFPVFIPRTIAGIPEKESAAFLFMFLALYFFIKSWNTDQLYKRVIFGACSGISTGLMALIWGAYAYIFFIIFSAAFLSFLFGNFEKKHIINYVLWIVFSLIFMILFSNRYAIGTTFTSFDRGVAIALLICVVFYHFAYPKISPYLSNKKYLSRVPQRLLSSLIFAVFLIILISLVLGPQFIFNRMAEIYSSLVKPATSRLIQTVAENRQPYLTEWMGNFGPYIFKIFVSFWLFLIGSLVLFWKMLEQFDKKDRIKLTLAFAFMLFTVLFSRYSGSSILNGNNFISLGLYGLGVIIFMFVSIKLYISILNRSEGDKIKSIHFEALLFFAFLFISLISARGFIRLVMLVVPPASIAIGYLGATCLHSVMRKVKERERFMSIILIIVLLIGILFSAYQLTKESINLAKSYVPSVYTQQWQKAMSWVRDNTPVNSVFAHWWDYGYWIQFIGERATVLDGGNDISYWNHLMGRYALTESDFSKTLDFLYAHNVTHFLIDSTDIGKYSAFSTIGSNSKYDRQSWIPTFLRDESQKQQRKNSTLEVYVAGTTIDEDIIYENNGSKIFLPANVAGIAGILLERSNNGSVISLNGYFVNSGKNYILPLKYYYDFSSGLIDLNNGISAGVFVYPKVDILADGRANIDNKGALLYLSPRTVKTNLVNYYLFDKSNPNFKIAHVESDIIINSFRDQNLDMGEFVYYEGLRGPIKIWDVTYPKDILLNQSYLEVNYPDSIRLA